MDCSNNRNANSSMDNGSNDEDPAAAADASLIVTGIYFCLTVCQALS